MTSACDLLSARDLWHAVKEACNEHMDTSSSFSVNPASKDSEPIERSGLLQQATDSLRAFRASAHLPCFMSQSEAAMVRMLATALTHENPGRKAAKRAARAIDHAFADVYGKPLKACTTKALKEHLESHNGQTSDEQHLQIASQYKFIREAVKKGESAEHSHLPENCCHKGVNACCHEKKKIVDCCNTHADLSAQWDSALKHSDGDAFASYLHVLNMAGALHRDPDLVERLVTQLSGGMHSQAGVEALYSTLCSEEQNREHARACAHSALILGRQASLTKESSELPFDSI